MDGYFVGSVGDFCYATSERFNAISLTHVPAHITYFSETSLQMAPQIAGLRLTF
jgi:hypothetical protein